MVRKLYRFPLLTKSSQTFLVYLLTHDRRMSKVLAMANLSVMGLLM